MSVTRKKTCYCHTCDKHYHYLGINSHRAMHRRKKESCIITYTYGDTYSYHLADTDAQTGGIERKQREMEK